MEIEDPVDALHFDFALAYKHLDKEKEEKFKSTENALENIYSMLKPIGSSLGVQYKEASKSDASQTAIPDDLPVEEVLKMIGGKKTMVKNHG